MKEHLYHISMQWTGNKYGYTHVAGEGGFDLTKYPAIQSWIDRIASEPKYIAME